jgi:class 3 adenylate cyclase/tetratricopeptide (TPR) repeat protein
VSCTACGADTGARDRFCPACGASLHVGRREARKAVTILFIDLVGSTSLAEELDPESLRHIMDRYYAGCSASIAEYDGVVEKFIGDAVMAVFGAIVVREDDAMRAVGASAGSLAALNDLNNDIASSHGVTMEARCGICSGEVIVSTLPGGDFRVVGDAVNTAARLQTAAGPGEILVDANTAEMIRPHVGLESLPPLHLRGKVERVPAWRVDLADKGEGAAAAAVGAGPFIGRNDDLTQIKYFYGRAVQRNQPCIVTVLGVPGIGKTRLISEFVKDLEKDGMTILTGRCSTYGRGMTYQPLAEALQSYPGKWPALANFLSEEQHNSSGVVARLLTVIDERAEPTGVSDIAWAVRRLLEILASTGPVIMVLEDLHWAEPTLLDLIDDIATWLTDVPVLLLCAARMELIESRPSWGGGKPCAVTLELLPLTLEQSVQLVGELTSQEVLSHQQGDFHSRLAAECGGNPLFVRLMLDVAGSSPDTKIPRSLYALLGAQLDKIPHDEREVLERAATIGRSFSVDVLLAMAEADEISAPQVRERLGRLVRRRLVQRTSSAECQFAQAVLRDATYNFTSKAVRERWHQFLARWYSDKLTTKGNGAAGLEIAYHVEAACTLRRDLRPGDRSLPPVARQARQILIAAGGKALGRHDLPAAAGLLERGRDLLPAGDPEHTPLALHISDTWLGLWNASRAMAALSAAQSALPDDGRNNIACQIQRLVVGLRLGEQGLDEVAAASSLIATSLEADPGDALGWCRFFQLRAYLQLAADRADDAATSLRTALGYARSLADKYEEERISCAVCEIAQWDATPVADGLGLCAELSGRFDMNTVLLIPILLTQARLTALSGNMHEARETLAMALQSANELHLDLVDAAALEVAGFVEALAGNYSGAESSYLRAQAILRSGGQVREAQTLASSLARALFEQGRITESQALLDQLAADGIAASTRTEVMVKALRGRLGSMAGAKVNAIAEARKAVQMAGTTQDPCLQGEALFDLAVTLLSAGHADEAYRTAASAVERYQQKGAAMPAAQVRRWVDVSKANLGRLPDPDGARRGQSGGRA